MKFALLLLAACGGRFTSFYGVDDYTKNLVGDVTEAINEEAGCRWLTVTQQNAVPVETNGKFLSEISERGWFDDISHRISLENPTETNSTSNYTILVHEIGHAIGLEHENGGIMEGEYVYFLRHDAISSFVAIATKHGLNPCPIK